jgi:F-type H+-transporting ATPase subunit b
MITFLIGTAHAADPVKSGGGSAFPPFEVSTFPSQLFWLALTFGTVYFLMSKIALPRISDILETRAARIDGDLKAAALMQEKARAAGEAYEKLLADAKANAQLTGQKAKDVASAASAERRKAVEADMVAKVAKAEAGISDVRDKALGNVASIAADAASDIVMRITKIAPSSDAVKKAIASLRGGA